MPCIDPFGRWKRAARRWCAAACAGFALASSCKDRSVEGGQGKRFVPSAPTSDAPVVSPWLPTGTLVHPTGALPTLGMPLPFSKAMLWLDRPEVYDAATGRWREVPAKPPCASAPDHTDRLARLSRLPGDLVFLIGATCGYDLGRDAWIAAPRFDVRGAGWALTQLDDDELLVTGGAGRESFRWNDEKATMTTPAPMVSPHSGHDGVRLLDHTVLIVSGKGAPMELFSPSKESFTALGEQRYDGRPLVLQDGRVLFVGAAGACGIYDPVIASFKPCAKLEVPREGFTETLLRDGRVLLAGGFVEGAAIADAQLYDPHLDTWTQLEALPHARSDHVAMLLSDGRVLIAAGRGGRKKDDPALAECVLFAAPTTP